MSNQTQVAKQEPVSVRFMNMVVSEFTGSVGEVALTNFQKRLAQNYFMAVDQALAKAEQKRNAQKNSTPIVWANVEMRQLALDVVAAARVGLDPAQANHISIVPYKNNTTGKYDIGFLDGYRGIELKAMKYGLDIPDSVTVELVHKNDEFRPIKKDHRNRVESYEFNVANPFNRGDIIGGFYYHAYSDNPGKNKLVIFSIEDILKRKPAYAAPEFWGGEKPIWKDGKKVGTEKVEGWFEKMCYKTIHRAAYKDITIDSQKIDDDYLRLKQMEESFSDAEVAEEIATNANAEIIDVDEAVDVTESPENEQNQGESSQKTPDSSQKAPERSQKLQDVEPDWA